MVLSRARALSGGVGVLCPCLGVLPVWRWCTAVAGASLDRPRAWRRTGPPDASSLLELGSRRWGMNLLPPPLPPPPPPPPPLSLGDLRADLPRLGLASRAAGGEGDRLGTSPSALMPSNEQRLRSSPAVLREDTLDKSTWRSPWGCVEELRRCASAWWRASREEEFQRSTLPRTMACNTPTASTHPNS